MKKIITLFFVIFCVNMIWAAKERIIIEYLSSEQQELELKRVSTIKFQNEFIDFVDFSGEVIAHREVKDVRKIYDGVYGRSEIIIVQQKFNFVIEIHKIM